MMSSAHWLGDIVYSHALLGSLELSMIGPEARSVVFGLVRVCAEMHTRYCPRPDPEGRYRIIPGRSPIYMLPLERWEALRPEVEPFFVIDGEFWRVRDRTWYQVRGGRKLFGYERPLISAALRSAVMKRDSWRCLYCGDSYGPFHCDHVIPVSRGGATTLDNLACACRTCNFSKGAKTPEEWLG